MGGGGGGGRTNLRSANLVPGSQSVQECRNVRSGKVR